VDETGWRQQKQRAWLQVAVTDQATAFRIEPARGADAHALHALVGESVGLVIVSDRFLTYARVPTRPVCAGLIFEEIFSP
jgi:hypothetical protein